MVFDLGDDAPWITFPDDLRCFRFQAEKYSPVEPHLGRGRFGDGDRLLLYVASDPSAATAEFYRRNLKLLARQSFVKHKLFELRVRTEGRVLDLRKAEDADNAGVSFERLTASEADELTRYAACRALAAAAEPLCCGIAYPSAAWRAEGVWCLALFGGPPQHWQATLIGTLAPPTITADLLRPIDPVG